MSMADGAHVVDLAVLADRVHASGRQSLISLLQAVQEADGHLSPGRIAEIAGLLGISESEIYAVATFYSRFRFAPPAEHTIQVCLGTACHVRGGQRVLREFEGLLAIRAGETTADGRFGLERVFCVGCCALGPVSVVDQSVHAAMSPKRVRSVLDACRCRSAPPSSEPGGGR